MGDSHGVPKVCVDCKRRYKGDRQTVQWCPNCGGEMRVIPYGPRRPSRRVVR